MASAISRLLTNLHNPSVLESPLVSGLLNQTHEAQRLESELDALARKLPRGLSLNAQLNDQSRVAFSSPIGIDREFTRLFPYINLEQKLRSSFEFQSPVSEIIRDIGREIGRDLRAVFAPAPNAEISLEGRAPYFTPAQSLVLPQHQNHLTGGRHTDRNRPAAGPSEARRYPYEQAPGKRPTPNQPQSRAGSKLAEQLRGLIRSMRSKLGQAMQSLTGRA